MDRLLVAEFPGFAIQADYVERQWMQQTNFQTEYRPIAGLGNTGWVNEQTLDLTGYLMQDLTTYFRQSFEQRSGASSVQWTAEAANPLTSFAAGYFESILVTTVPLTDSMMAAALFTAPGFIPYSGLALDPGNFNRDHVIHGRFYVHGIDSALTADAFTDNGAAYTRVVQERDFSSLEPVAVDTLYIYRMFVASDPSSADNDGRLTQITEPAARVLLDATMGKEEDIPYLMRLKRGYELANQV